MELPDFIQLGNEAPALHFLVIGGWAVGAHGHARATFDVDFMVRRADRDLWIDRVTKRGLKLFRESNVFAQFAQTEADGFDLMFVNDQTFEKIWDASEERIFGEARARVTCLDHLLALKLHALKQSVPHRTSKDADDVEVLLRRHQIDWSILITKPFFSSMEHSNSTKPLSDSCAIRDAARPSLDFDLPDPEGFTSLPTEVSLARMLKGIRQMRAWFPAGLRTAEERWRSKSNQEFIL